MKHLIIPISKNEQQEKVGTICKNNPNSYMFQLSKNNGRINGKCISCCYEKGDNDFYWLHCKMGNFIYFLNRF